MTRLFSLAAAAVLSTLSACSVEGARLAVPGHLAAQTEALELRGMGGFRSGQFHLAGVPGHFTRGADRLGIMDPLLVRNSGGGRFALAASPLAPELEGRCSYREGQLNAGVIAITPRRFAYHCDLSGAGHRPLGRLSIADRNAPFGAIHARSEREGILDFGGQRLVVRSVHHMQGSRFSVPAPLGYMFVADGREVGAVDLNGPVKTVFAPRTGPYREAVIAGALALSILWDPADVQDD